MSRAFLIAFIAANCGLATTSVYGQSDPSPRPGPSLDGECRIGEPCPGGKPLPEQGIAGWKRAQESKEEGEVRSEFGKGHRPKDPGQTN